MSDNWDGIPKGVLVSIGGREDRQGTITGVGRIESPAAYYRVIKYHYSGGDELVTEKFGQRLVLESNFIDGALEGHVVFADLNRLTPITTDTYDALKEGAPA